MNTKRPKRLSEETIDCNEDNSYDKHSYSDRICDDLSEVILDFLPIEDKLKYIGVSKQFQRCLRNVWPKQTVLNVTNELSDDRHAFHRLLRERPNGESTDEQVYDIDITGFEQLLTKFRNISEIRFGSHSKTVYNIKNNNESLKVMIKCCNRLQTFASDLNECEKQVVLEFGQKFGQQLKRLELWGDISAAKLLIRFCPNVLSISGILLETLFIRNNVILATNLKRLSVSIIRDKALFDSLVKNCPKLTHLDINLCFQTFADTSDILMKVSKLKDLTVLSIGLINNDLYDNRMATGFEAIGMNCKSLKSLQFKTVSMQTFNARHCFESFLKFSSLKKLRFLSTLSSDSNAIEDENLDLNCLKNCKLLTHLDVKTNQINDEFLDKIDSIVPNLKRLEITTSNGITDNVLQSIARLKHIKSVTLRGFGPQEENVNTITDSGVLSLINNCDHLETIHVYNKTSITDKTIEALIEKSVQKPSICFDYNFKGIEEEFNFKEIFERSVYPLKNIVIRGQTCCEANHHKGSHHHN